MRVALVAVGVVLILGAPWRADAQIAPAVLAPLLRPHVTAERFQIVTSVRGLPLGVREELQRMFGSTAAAIADPDAPFQATAVADPLLPARRMRVAGCSQDHCLVYYERGGVVHTWYAVLFHWTPGQTRVEAGGIAPEGLRAVDDVRTVLLAGGLKQARSW